MFGFLRSRIGPYIGEIARRLRRLGVRILSQDDDSLICEIPGEFEAYTLAVGIVDGKICFCTWALATWRGSAPAAIHGLMEELDGRDRRVTFKVSTSDSGKTRCRLTCGGLQPAELDDDLFTEIAGDLLGKAAAVDSVLRKHGYV